VATTPDELVAARRQAIADSTAFDARDINRNFDDDYEAYGVVRVDYPFTTGGAKVRPVRVAQNDRNNVRMTITIVAQISGNTARANDATEHLIELAAEPGWGLARDSALVATTLLTMHH